MGNNCCSDRRALKQEIISSRITQSSVKPSRSFKPFLVPPSLSIEEISIPSPAHNNPILDDSLIEELEYTLKEPKDLSAEDRFKILKVLDSSKANIPSNEQEYFEGFSMVQVQVSDQVLDNRVIFFSNYAIYLLKPEDLSYVYRRLPLENIQLILFDTCFESFIFHVTRNEILGDLWIFTHDFEDVENIHNCCQTLFRLLTKRFIPVSCFEEKVLKTKFNNVSLTFKHKMLDDEFLRVNNIVVQEGKLGEMIKFFKKTRSSVKGNLVETIVVLTNLALYCLTLEYRFIYRVDLKNVKSLLVTENLDKILIEKNDGDRLLLMLGSKFLTDLEKMIMQVTGQRVALLRKPTLNVEEFLNETRKKRFRRS
jgi:hypothetical protein